MSKTLRIRMYNVGFGDCFLICLPDKRSILVDAGFHSQGKGAFDGNQLAAQVVADLVELTGDRRLDVVIATHRHQDHIYAFNSDAWDEVSVGEVWLPWVEDRSNRKAVNLWKKQQRFAAQLAAALPTFQLQESDERDVEFMLWNAGLDMPGVASVGGWSNAGALDRLHEGFAQRDRAKPRFLPSTEQFPQSFECASLPGVRVHVLGPPRDPELIRELDPSADGETYRALALRALTLQDAAAVDAAAPFGTIWQVPDDVEGMRLEADEEARIDALARGADAVFAAQKVDGMINSTSLVLVLEIGKARLLLPGDAEWGTWKRILADSEARALVHGASFLKVGHHGSHNATSKTLLEEVLKRGIPAMISTQQGAGNYRNDIPLKALLGALDEHGVRYVRSDKPRAALPRGFSRPKGAKWLELRLPC